MNKVALSAYLGTIIRYGIVWAVAKFGLGSLIEDVEIQKIADAVVLLAITLYGVWSKRKALSTPPFKAGFMVLLMLLPALLLTGCAVIVGKAGSSSYTGIAFGEKASSTLAGLNITETKKEKGNVVTESGVGVDKSSASGEADMGKILGNLLLLGLQAQGVPARPPAAVVVEPEPESTPEVQPASTNAISPFVSATP